MFEPEKLIKGLCYSCLHICYSYHSTDWISWSCPKSLLGKPIGIFVWNNKKRSPLYEQYNAKKSQRKVAKNHKNRKKTRQKRAKNFLYRPVQRYLHLSWLFICCFDFVLVPSKAEKNQPTAASSRKCLGEKESDLREFETIRSPIFNCIFCFFKTIKTTEKDFFISIFNFW